MAMWEEQEGPAPVAHAVAHLEAVGRTVRATLYIPHPANPDRMEVRYDGLGDGPDHPPRAAVANALRRIAEQLDPQGWVWLGDLSGMEVVPVLRDTPPDQATPLLQLDVRHRCGWAQRQPFDGITEDGAALLGNLVERAAAARAGHACPPHEPSPEHRARVAQWTQRQSGSYADGPGCVPAVVQSERPSDDRTEDM